MTGQGIIYALQTPLGCALCWVSGVKWLGAHISKSRWLSREVVSVPTLTSQSTSHAVQGTVAMPVWHDCAFLDQALCVASSSAKGQVPRVVMQGAGTTSIFIDLLDEKWRCTCIHGHIRSTVTKDRGLLVKCMVKNEKAPDQRHTLPSNYRKSRTLTKGFVRNRWTRHVGTRAQIMRKICRVHVPISKR